MSTTPFVDPGKPPRLAFFRNRWFRRLTMRQKAVAVARDAISSLEAKRIAATSCTYFMLDGPAKRSPIERLLNRDVDLQRVVGRSECDVCAIGAAFVSAVRLGDGCTIPPDSVFIRTETVLGVASVAFHDQELTDMEFLFERRICRNRVPSDRARLMLGEFERLIASERLERIMRLVVSGDGSFLGGKERIEEIPAHNQRNGVAEWATPEPNSL